MNRICSSRWLLVLFVCFLGLPEVASAAELQANVIYELVADRSRMIQVSLVFVALGCALLWWRR